MADNLTADAGSGGATLAADDISGVHYPRTKLIIGADGTNDGDVASGNPLPVTGTVTANLSATDNAVLDTIDAALDAINAKLAGGTVIGDVNLGATDNAVLDDIAQKLGDIETAVQILDNAISGSEMQTDVITLPASTNTLEVVGDVAHDAAAAGNPVAIAARATNSIEGLTQVGANDATFLAADLNGVIVTRPHTTLEEILSERVSNTNGTSTDFSTFAAGGAGIHNYVTTISVYNSSATDGHVDFRDGSAGSIIFTAAAPATSGSIINLPVPLKGAANTALAYDVSGALSTVYISVVGFQAQG